MGWGGGIRWPYLKRGSRKKVQFVRVLIIIFLAYLMKIR